MHSRIIKCIESFTIFITLLSSVLIFIGFISVYAQNRILGINNLEIEPILFIKRGGIFFLQTSQFFLHLTFNHSYIKINHFVLFIFISVSFFLIFIPRSLHRKIYESTLSRLFQKLNIKKENALHIVVLFYIISIFMLLGTTIRPFCSIYNVLQPKETSHKELLEYPQYYGFSYEKSKIKYNNLIAEYENRHSKNENVLYHLFSLKNENNRENRKETYFFAFFLLTLIALSTLIILTRYRKYLKHYISHFIVYIIFFFILTSASYMHGAMGTDYLYPVIDLKFIYNAKIEYLENVILVRNSQKNITLINRLDCMKIIEIPYSNIIKIEQKFIISLFENCSKKEGEIILCEEPIL